MLIQVDIHSKDKKKVQIYQMMCRLISAEEKCKEKVRDSEEEVRKVIINLFYVYCMSRLGPFTSRLFIFCSHLFIKMPALNMLVELSIFSDQSDMFVFEGKLTMLLYDVIITT